jgi:antitoxin (DNA-binding transcriptional repressor) of toxin-antitoxin stability system
MEVTVEFVSIRDMRTRPGEVWQQLQEKGDLVVTSSGRPFALMIDVADQDVEQLLLAVRQARAQLAVTRMRRQAAERGLDRLTSEEIESEIMQARRARRT